MGDNHGEDDHNDDGGHRIMPCASSRSSPQRDNYDNDRDDDAFVVVPGGGGGGGGGEADDDDDVDDDVDDRDRDRDRDRDEQTTRPRRDPPRRDDDDDDAAAAVNDDHRKPAALPRGVDIHVGHDDDDDDDDGHYDNDDNDDYDNDEGSGECDGRFLCSICLDAVSDEPVVTRCGHLYCWPCLYTWLEPGIDDGEYWAAFGGDARDRDHDYYGYDAGGGGRGGRRHEMAGSLLLPASRPLSSSSSASASASDRRGQRRRCPVCKAACTVDSVVPIYVNRRVRRRRGKKEETRGGGDLGRDVGDDDPDPRRGRGGGPTGTRAGTMADWSMETIARRENAHLAFNLARPAFNLARPGYDPARPGADLGKKTFFLFFKFSQEAHPGLVITFSPSRLRRVARPPRPGALAFDVVGTGTTPRRRCQRHRRLHR